MIRTFTMATAALSLVACGVVAVVASAPQASAGARTNATTVAKNQAWPLKGFVTMTPCALKPCQEA